MAIIGKNQSIKTLGDLREFVKQFKDLSDDYEIIIDAWWNGDLVIKMDADISYSEKTILVDTDFEL